MAINFPSAPTNGQQFTSGGITWTFDGTKWTVGAATSGVYLPLAGGTMTGQILLPGNPVAALDAAPKQYVDALQTSVASTYLPLAGGTMTGPLTGVNATFSGNVTGNRIFIDGPAGTPRQLEYDTAGSLRWIVITDGGVESGANAGSDFDIQSYDDTGASLATPFRIIRSTGIVQINNKAGVAPIIDINAPAGTNRYIRYQTSLFNRWAMVVNNTAEGGGNAGSDWSLIAYADSGAFLSTPIACKRSTGVVTFAQAIVNGSDRRLKENIAPIAGALDKVLALQGVTYTVLDNDKPHVGLIAQDTQPVLPEVVFETGQPLDAEGNAREGEEPMLGISYGNIVAVLIEAVKELSAKVAALEGAPLSKGPPPTMPTIEHPISKPRPEETPHGSNPNETRHALHAPTPHNAPHDAPVASKHTRPAAPAQHGPTRGSPKRTER